MIICIDGINKIIIALVHLRSAEGVNNCIKHVLTRDQVKYDLTTEINTKKKSSYQIFNVIFWHKFLILTSLDMERFGENFDLKAKTW